MCRVFFNVSVRYYILTKNLDLWKVNLLNYIKQMSGNTNNMKW
jgi:hypothetical protein